MTGFAEAVPIKCIEGDDGKFVGDDFDGVIPAPLKRVNLILGNHIRP
jgi:hypothetical protein